MKENVNFIKQRVNILVILSLMIITFFVGLNYLIENFKNTSESEAMYVDNSTLSCSNFIETLTLFGTSYFNLGSSLNESEYFSKLTYQPETNEYSLDSLKDMSSTVGNLTGSGEIPSTGIKKDEINLTLNYIDFFNTYYHRVSDLTWIYYTSKNDFMIVYPWVPSTEFKYQADIKNMNFYTLVLPENNPDGHEIWTPAYIDKAGKGLMVTLSKPLYFSGEFMGAVSLDITTASLSQMLAGDYNGFLMDDDFSVIASSQNLPSQDTVKKITDYISFSEKEKEKIKSLESNTLSLIHGHLIYKATFEYAPWTLLITTPLYIVLLKAFLLSMPLAVISTLLIISFNEIRYRKKAEEKIKSLSLTDYLTGLHNRRFLDMIFDSEIQRTERYHQSLSAIMLDLDYFKRVNDTYGHPIGDEVLKMVAQIIKKNIRRSDILVRLGGEEFFIVLPTTTLEGANEVAEKIRLAIEKSEHPIAGSCTASFGVVERQDDESVASIYKRVDDALYRAKETGRNRVICFANADKSPLASILLKWNHQFESGYKELDKQHWNLLVLANNLIYLSFTKNDALVISEQLDQLLLKIVEHFEYEEKLQLEIGFPDLEMHKQIHSLLLKKAFSIKESNNGGSIKISEFFSYMLDDIILGHMLSEDTKFFPYLNK